MTLGVVFAVMSGLAGVLDALSSTKVIIMVSAGLQYVPDRMPGFCFCDKGNLICGQVRAFSVYLLKEPDC